MNESAPKKKWWLAAAALIPSIWAGLQIVDRLSPSKPDLIAMVDYGPIPITPRAEARADLLSKLREEKRSELFRADTDKSASNTKKQLASNSTKAGADPISVADSLDKFIPYVLTNVHEDPRGYVHIVIRNQGSQSAADVRLVVPDANQLAIKRDAESEFTLQDGRAASLGTLHPAESIEIRAFEETPPNLYSLEEVSVTHSTGVGTLDLRVPVGRLGRFVDTYFWPMVIAAPLFIPLFGLLVAFIMQRRGWNIVKVAPGWNVVSIAPGYTIKNERASQSAPPQAGRGTERALLVVPTSAQPEAEQCVSRRSPGEHP